jgi:hypothetical protein
VTQRTDYELAARISGLILLVPHFLEAGDQYIWILEKTLNVSGNDMLFTHNLQSLLQNLFPVFSYPSFMITIHTIGSGNNMYDSST